MSEQSRQQFEREQATEFQTGDVINLHASNLVSPNQGRERALVDTAMRFATAANHETKEDENKRQLEFISQATDFMSWERGEELKDAA